MKDTERFLFINLTAVAGLQMALTASLKRLAKNGEDMVELKVRYLRDIKNTVPQGPVPEDVMQSAVANLLELVESAFRKARD